MSAAFDLDHVGIAVRDLDAAAAAFGRLGFTLTELSHHMGPAPDGTLQPAGTGNRNIILERGYIELIAVAGPGYTGRLDPLLARYEGIHLIALGTASAAAAASVMGAAAGEPVVPRLLSRPFRERGRDFTARFAILDPPEGRVPEAQLFAIEHLTRDAIWQPHLMRHANGAVALDTVTLCVADPQEVAARIGRLFGMPVDGTSVRLAPGVVEVLGPAGFGERFPGAKMPPLPCVAALRLATEDLAATWRYFAGQRIETPQHGGALHIPAEAACGALIEFVEARA